MTSVTTTDNGSRMRTTVRTRSTQKLPEFLVLVLRQAPNQRNGDAHPDRAAGERLHTEPGGQARHGRGLIRRDNSANWCWSQTKLRC